MPYSLERLMLQGRAHWEEYAPKRYRELEKSGALEGELRAAAQMTLDEMRTLMHAGYQEHDAWAIAREQFLILPEEEGPEVPMPYDPAWD